MTDGASFWNIIPEQPTINNVPGLQPLQVAFTQLLSGVFAPNGTGPNGEQGICPDPAAAPMSCLQYLSNRADVITRSAQQRPLIRLADKNLKIIADLTEEMNATFEEKWDDSGSGKIVLRYENWLVDWFTNQIRIDEDVHILVDPIPTQRSWRTRWGGKVHEIHIKQNEDGTKTVELLAISMREHAKKLLIAANPIFAPEIQLPKMWILPGPTRTIAFITFMVNLARIFMPGLSTITNILNPFGWINPLSLNALANIDPLNWPIQVAFVNPVFDQSRWSVLGATWTDWHSATTDMFKDAGVVMRAYTWLEEDEDSPHTELAGMLSLLGPLAAPADQLIRPGRNCVVFSLEDMSGQHGPTGSVLDGLLNVIGVTLDDLLTTLVFNTSTGEFYNGEKLVDVSGTTPLIEALLGVAPQPPKAIWRDGQFTGMISADVAIHKGAVKTTMTGGKSPALVNELQTFGIRYALAQLSTVIDENIGLALTLTPDNLAIQVPATPGLDNLYQGQLDNTLFAWERYTDPVRAFYAGDLAYNEWLERGSGTAYELSSILAIREGNYKTRAFQGFQAVVRNGMPWLIDTDVRLGERAGFEFDGVIYVDQITAIKREWDRQKPVLVSMSIGDDRDHRDPIARAMRFISATYSMVSALAGEGTVFS